MSRLKRDAGVLQDTPGSPTTLPSWPRKKSSTAHKQHDSQSKSVSPKGDTLRVRQTGLSPVQHNSPLRHARSGPGVENTEPNTSPGRFQLQLPPTSSSVSLLASQHAAEESAWEGTTPLQQQTAQARHSVQDSCLDEQTAFACKRSAVLQAGRHLLTGASTLPSGLLLDTTCKVRASAPCSRASL